MDKAKLVFEKLAASMQMIGNAVAKRYVEIEKGTKSMDKTIEQLTRMKAIQKDGTSAGHYLRSMQDIKAHDLGQKVPMQTADDINWRKEYLRERAANPRKPGEIR